MAPNSEEHRRLAAGFEELAKREIHMDDVTTIATTIAPKLSREGAAFLSGICFGSLLSPPAFGEFASAWSNLGQDEYLPGGATYRKRRYGRLLAKPGPGNSYTLNPMSPATFQQPAELIPLYRGRPRTFEPIGEDALVSPLLLALMNIDLAIITAAEGSRDAFIVGLHMIRVVVLLGLSQPPAPEGRHTDGHCYVAMHLMNKRGCVGGESRVFLPGASEPILEATLTESLDTLIVDDRRVEHAVTAVRALEYEGTRDMLLVDFDLTKGPTP
jgi:hypothetical protein